MTDTEFSRPLSIEHIDNKPQEKTIEATAEECTAIAKRFDLESVKNLKADIKAAVSSHVYHVTGTVEATVTQTSIVSGEPISKQITNDIDAYYTDTSRVASFEHAKRKKDGKSEDGLEEYEIRDEKDDPERITNGIIDLGEIATQFLGLALDDYPRGENEDNGDYIEVKPEDAKPNPFAALAQLKKDK